ncbi:OLC1v1008740C1 [Oldenlandia corymbosa var. corymbosa]|uniref:OLC1v1008740C1 n=1 Tax=Oldenlandia corymbosa var. corymbosa TaxID=529605 RepID=A0AAV1DMG1_OLDCO|nr:OLC1v1008740C1 [Oldenlandia corymbosa var. corymbosa]
MNLAIRCRVPGNLNFVDVDSDSRLFEVLNLHGFDNFINFFVSDSDFNAGAPMNLHENKEVEPDLHVNIDGLAFGKSQLGFRDNVGSDIDMSLYMSSGDLKLSRGSELVEKDSFFANNVVIPGQLRENVGMASGNVVGNQSIVFHDVNDLCKTVNTFLDASMTKGKKKRKRKLNQTKKPCTMRRSSRIFNSGEASKAYTEVEFKRAMTNIQSINPAAYKWLDDIGNIVWARHAFSETLNCDHVTNNISESFNSWLGDLREMPILTMVNTYRGRVMTKINKRYAKACTWTNEVTVHVIEEMKTAAQECRNMKYWLASGTTYEVKDDNKSYVDYCDQSLSKDQYIRAYSHLINPIPDIDFWPEIQVQECLPPVLRRRVGRPKKARKRGKDELKRSSTIKCSRCKGFGHNKRSCAGGPVRARNARRGDLSQMVGYDIVNQQGNHQGVHHRESQTRQQGSQHDGNQMLTDMPNQSRCLDSANQPEMNSIVFLSGHDQPGGKLLHKLLAVTKGSSSLEKLFGSSRATSLLGGELAGRFVTGQQSNISKLRNVDAYKSPNDNVSSSKPPSAIPKQPVVKVSSSQPTGSIKKQAAAMVSSSQPVNSSTKQPVANVSLSQP